MKKLFFAAALILFLLSPSVLAYEDIYHHVDLEVTEVPYRPVYAFFGMNFEGADQQSGANIGLTSARNGDIQVETLVGYRAVSKDVGVFDIMLGGCYFPKKPTFSLGDTPVRLKISALGGLGMANDMLFTTLLGISLVFSSGDDPSGMVLGLVLRPAVSSGATSVPSSVSLRMGFLFAPVAEQY